MVFLIPRPGLPPTHTAMVSANLSPMSHPDRSPAAAPLSPLSALSPPSHTVLRAKEPGCLRMEAPPRGPGPASVSHSILTAPTSSLHDRWGDRIKEAKAPLVWKGHSRITTHMPQPHEQGSRHTCTKEQGQAVPRMQGRPEQQLQVKHLP